MKYTVLLLFLIGLYAHPACGQDPRCVAHVHPLQAEPGAIYLKAIDSSGTGQPIQYRWSNGDSTPLIRVSAYGQYCCAITYSDGCEASECYIYEPCKVAAYPTNSTKYALLAVPKPEYPVQATYQWSTGDTTAYMETAQPGLYCVTATFMDGCTAQTCMETLGTPCSLALSYALDTTAQVPVVYVQAHLDALGEKRYSWDTGDTTATIALYQQTYLWMTATNQLGCYRWETLDLRCMVQVDAANGELKAKVKSPFPPYRYQWSTGDSTASISPTSSLSYSLTVTDRFGSTAVHTAYYHYPCVVSIKELPDGTLKSTCNAKPPFIYHWEPGNFSTQDILPDSIGYYYLTVTDVNGCTALSSIFWYDPDTCWIDVLVMDDSVAYGYARMFARPMGDYWDYHNWDYTWNTGQEGYYLYITESGEYCLTATHRITGCSATTCKQVDIPNAVPPPPDGHVVRPNPVRQRVEILISEESTLILTDSNGQKVAQQTASPPSTELNVADLPSGLYFLTLRTASAVQTLRVVKQ